MKLSACCLSRVLIPLVPVVPAFAQSTATGGLEEVVVTAQRREQNLSDVGMTVASLGGDFLASRNIVSAERLGEVVSALTVAVNPDGTPVYTLRGVGFNATNLGAQPTVSIYMDEAPLPYGPMTQGPIFDIQRLEVLKGPQGTLYGQNSTGGAINYITAKPSDQAAVGLRASYGRFNTLNAEAFVNGPLGDSLSARLAVSALRADDWQENYLRDGSHGEQERYGARLLLDWLVSDAVKAAINLNGWIDRSDNQMPAFVMAIPRVPANAIPGLLEVPPARGVRQADWDPDTAFDRDNRQWQGALRFDIDLPNGLSVTSLSNYVKTEIDSRFDNDGTAFKLGDAWTIGEVEVFSQELRLSGQFSGDSNFLIGANYQDDSIDEGQAQVFDGTSSTQNISSPPLPPPGLGSIGESENRGKQSNRALGIFGNVDLAVSDRLSLVGGIRYTEVEHENRSCTADTGNGDWAHVVNGLLGLLTGSPGSVQPGECVTIRDGFDTTTPHERFDEDNVSWRVGVNFKSVDETLLYALVSRGYKAGNYPIINAIAGSSLRPVTQEELTAYELGVKTSLGNFFRIDSSVYYYRYKDKQLLTNTVDPIFGPVPTLGNVPDSDAYGIDVEMTWRPVDELTMRAAVAYQDTTLGKFTDYDVYGNTVELKGNSFNFAPELTLTADAEYRRPLTDDIEGFIGAGVTHNSETYADLAESPELRIDPYTLVSLRAGVASRSGAWEVSLWGQNVTDEDYWTHAVLGYDGLYRVMGRPATYGVTVSFRP